MVDLNGKVGFKSDAKLRIGILSLQGDFAEHARMLEQLGAQPVLVKHAPELDDIAGLIIPGGESTTIAILSRGDEIFEAITSKVASGMPVYGTCMGAIFLAKSIELSTQGRLAVMDITVKRNAFGPQRFSREETIPIPALGDKPYPAVFIRGPVITACAAAVQVLARVDEGIVMARQDNMLVTAFHPELTDDERVHRYFLSMIEDHQCGKQAKSAPAFSMAKAAACP